MMLNKELIKQGLKNQLISIWHMSIFNIISFIVFWLSNIGIKPTGKVSGNSFIALTKYEVNIFFVIFSWILFLLLFSIFYTKFLKKDLKKQIELHWIFVIIFFIVSVIFCLVEFILLIITLIISTGFFSIIVNYPNGINVIVLAYIIGYIIIDFILEILKRKENIKTLSEK
ncbi:MAG: hypothetical protein PHS24_01350 [Bacilli bacterium]|nr:hypothetical protein [Bacilli bacterium]